jgi:hypothetical protein
MSQNVWDNSEWTLVVYPQNEEDAKKAFADWLKNNRKLAEKLSDDDIRVDCMRVSNGKCKFRYWIKKK